MTFQDNKTVYAAGVFDMLHYGHVQYLEQAKKFGTKLIVGLLTDEGTRRYKPHYPVMTYQERLAVVSALRAVDLVVPQDDTDPTETFKALNIQIDVMVRGDDYKDTPQGSAWVKSQGGVVVRIPYCRSVSSTEIKQRILKGFNG
jgi:rfaE bifunctional protein nucleotidyltransferase chain/domain